MKSKRMRLPNGFGQISEIKNKRLRKPFRAMVTVGKDGNGRPICKLLKPVSYFKTYNEAYEALVTYNKNPYDPDKNITMDELFTLWFKEVRPKYKSRNSAVGVLTSWDYCSVIHKMRVTDIRAIHIKKCIDNASRIVKNADGEHEVVATGNIKLRIKSMLNQLFDYAVTYEYAEKNYARLLSYTMPTYSLEVKGHIIYTENEMEVLWQNIENDIVKFILIQCYSGWRPMELLKMRIENINLEEGWFCGGFKTAAGTDRVVPIHSKVLPLVRELYEKAKNNRACYLCGADESRTDASIYNDFLRRYKAMLNTLGLNPKHRLHDGRKHFVTMAKKKGLDEYAIKRIVGHSIQDLTEKVYTERDLEWLKTEMKKI